MGNAELDEVAPTFRELLEGSGVSFVQAYVADVDLAGKKVSVVGALSDDLGGFMVSDNDDESEVAGAVYILPCLSTAFFVFFQNKLLGRLLWDRKAETNPRRLPFVVQPASSAVGDPRSMRR